MKTNKNSRRSTIQPPAANMWHLAALIVAIFAGSALFVGLAKKASADYRAGGVPHVAFTSATSVVPDPPVVPIVQEPLVLEAPVIKWLPEVMKPVLGLLTDACNRHRVDPRFCVIVALVESAGNHRAVSNKGAVGIMQIMPNTASLIATERQIDFSIYNDWENVDAGAWLLADELSYFGLPESQDPDWQRTVTLAAAAYNGGRVPASRIDYDTLVVGGDCALRYPDQPELGYDDEMRRYACWVGGLWQDRNLEQSDNFDKWHVYGQKLITDAEAVAAAEATATPQQ